MAMTLKQVLKEILYFLGLTGCALVILLGLFQFMGCASVDRVRFNTEMRAALVNIEKMQATFKALQTGDVAALQARDVNLGGDGDSINSWILSVGMIVIVICVPGGGKFYEMVWRPMRLHRETQEQKKNPETVPTVTLLSNSNGKVPGNQ